MKISFDINSQTFYAFLMNEDLREPVKRRVGGTLAVLPPLVRLEALRKNARWLLGGKWNPPKNDGTHVRKIVGHPR